MVGYLLGLRTTFTEVKETFSQDSQQTPLLGTPEYKAHSGQTNTVRDHTRLSTALTCRYLLVRIQR